MSIESRILGFLMSSILSIHVHVCGSEKTSQFTRLKLDNLAFRSTEIRDQSGLTLFCEVNICLLQKDRVSKRHFLKFQIPFQASPAAIVYYLVVISIFPQPCPKSIYTWLKKMFTYGSALAILTLASQSALAQQCFVLGSCTGATVLNAFLARDPQDCFVKFVYCFAYVHSTVFIIINFSKVSGTTTWFQMVYILHWSRVLLCLLWLPQLRSQWSRCNQRRKQLRPAWTILQPNREMPEHKL